MGAVALTKTVGSDLTLHIKLKDVVHFLPDRNALIL